MFTKGEMAKILETEAKKFRLLLPTKRFLKVRQGNTIGEELAWSLIESFLKHCYSAEPKLEEVKFQLQKAAWHWAPVALYNIRRNSHTKQVRTFNRNTLDALLVDYINFAYLPGDLGLNVEHIR